MNLSLQKTDLTRVFIIKPKHPGRLITKTHSRTIHSLVSQPAFAVKGADKSELQPHHCMFEQIKLVNDMRTAVHNNAHLSLTCRLPNHICFDVFDRCFCKVETRVCETLLSRVKR